MFDISVGAAGFRWSKHHNYVIDVGRVGECRYMDCRGGQVATPELQTVAGAWITINVGYSGGDDCVKLAVDEIGGSGESGRYLVGFDSGQRYVDPGAGFVFKTIRARSGCTGAFDRFVKDNFDFPLATEAAETVVDDRRTTAIGFEINLVCYCQGRAM